MSPLLTIAIPFYNNSHTLGKAIASVTSQSYRNLEILLVDDGSTDDSLEIARKHELRDERIRVYSDGTNKGLISRLNEIIVMAKGTYLARMDADDLIDPEKIEKQVTYLIANPEVDVVTTGLLSIDNHLQAIGKRACEARDPDVYHVFRNGDNLLHASMVARTSWFKLHPYLKGFDRAEDRELFTRTIGTSVYRIIPEPLYFYMDSQNITLEKYLKSYSSERKAIARNWRGKISLLSAVLLFVRSCLKSVVIRFYFGLGLEQSLFISKNAPLNKTERERYSRVLDSIKELEQSIF